MNEHVENKCKLKHEPAYYQTTFFKWRQRIGFGISDYACNLAYLLVNTYLLFYYTNCAGLGAGAVGFMFVITKIFDGVTDYLVGIMIDRTNTKMGRNRPWMFWGAPVLAVGMVLLFCVPVGWAAGPKLVWAYLTYMVFSFGYTLVNIPMGSILPSLSADSVERTKIVTSRTIFSNLGSLTSAAMVIPMVYFFAGGQDAGNAALAVGYRNTNIILGIIVIVIMWICVMSIEEVNPPMIVKKVKGEGILKDLGYVFRTKPFMLMLGVAFVLFIGYYAMYNAIQYYFTYVLGDVSKMSLAVSLLTITPIVTQLLSTLLNAKISKRNIMQIGAVVDLVAYIVLFFSTNTTIVYIAVAFVGLGFGLRQVMYFSMLADCVDYGEWKFGKSLAGTQGAVLGFAGKISSAIASAAISFLLVQGAYDANAAVQASSAVTAIRIGFAGISIVTCLISIFLMIPYDLDKNYAKIKKEIDAKRVGDQNKMQG
ncbi:MAG: glycoside-pentoside-hexuronide (GPH):cation symporter [Hespellia sp.]|nr:glycoside-pentoside-hexuronide (GPH):cation symporter [Hespellia sp.]